MMKHNIPTPRQSQSGVTLIEVLVAILIFSFGLLGFVGLQARAIQYSMSAEDSNRAALLANDIASTIVTTGAGSASASASAVSAWQTRVSTPASGGLPNGQGTVSTAVSAVGNVATITLTWRANGAANGATNSINKYVTQVIN